MALEGLREWARTQLPIPHPRIAEIQVQGVVDGLGASHLAGEINIPMLDRGTVSSDFYVELLTKVSRDLLRPKVTVVPIDLALQTHPSETLALLVLPIASPPIHESSLPELIDYPVIADLFEALAHWGCAGRTYRTEEKPSSKSKDVSRRVQELDRTICRHGLQRYACAICAEEAEHRKARTKGRRKRPRKARTLNVFDLLLPYLQPPLETLLAEPVLFPPGRRPYDYQIQGIKFLAEHSAALLGDEMGLGKTIQTIVALQLLFRRGRIGSVLILCKRSLLGTWEKELHKWAPELYVTKVRGTREEREWLWSAPASVHLTTYDTLRQDIDRKLAIEDEFDVAVLDEVQEIKNPATHKSRAVREIEARYKWGLSGTPLENKIEDVEAIFSYLEPSLFRSSNVHKSPTYDHSQGLSVATVKRKIAPYFLRRRLKDVMSDLPEKVVNEIWLDLTDGQRASYDDAYSRARERLSRPGATRVHAFSLLSQLKQICNMDPKTGESCKLEYLADELESIVENDRKALVFSHFPKVTLSKLTSPLAQFAPALFDGTLNDRQRDELISRFQDGEEPKVLLMSVQAGGVGLTLTRANHVFHFDHWWNPAVARQAEGRAHRIGQEETVFVFDIYTRETIEERIHALLGEKQQLFDEVIDDLSAEYVQGKITDEDLFDLFDLELPAHLRHRPHVQVPDSPSPVSGSKLFDIAP